MGRGPYRPSNQPVSVSSVPTIGTTTNPYMDATIGAITNPGMAGPSMDGAMSMPAPGVPGVAGGSYKPGSDQPMDNLMAGATLGGGTPGGSSSSRGGYDPKLLEQFDAIGKQNGRQWRDDEYAQWLGPNGYLMKDDINGQGAKIGAWSGGEIDPYWQWRIGTHARGDYNGDNPAELGAGDANMNKGKAGASTGGQSAFGTGGIDSLLSGDPMARIQEALGKINGQGQVNLDALLKQLQGV